MFCEYWRCHNLTAKKIFFHAQTQQDDPGFASYFTLPPRCSWSLTVGALQGHLAQLVAERGETATAAKRVQEENARLEKQLVDARRKVRASWQALEPPYN